MGLVHVGQHDERATSNVGSFISNLPELLGAMVVDPRCLVAVVEFEDVRYVQFLAPPNGALIAEVVSNFNIGDALALSPEGEAQLRRAGWSEPSFGPTPNWRYEAMGVAGVLRIVAMTRDVVYTVLGESDRNVVSVRIWEAHASSTSNDDSLESARLHSQRRRHDLARPLADD